MSLATGFLLLLPITQAWCNNFQWTAFVDRKTGVATSRETSKVASWKHQDKVSARVFALYPSWLASPRVTLGMLQTHDQDDGSTCLRDRLFGVNLLIFGQPVIQKNSTIEIPIVGGAMALPSRESGEYQGSLVFSLQESQIVTQIDGGYRPLLIGRPPISKWRLLFYKSTQSLIHAYVMWRFHGYCGISFKLASE